MSSKKISDLNELLSIGGNDLFAVVDTANNETKKTKLSTIATSIVPYLPVYSTPNLQAVLTAGNNAGGLTIENVSNSTLNTGLVNKGYVDSTPRVYIKDLSWFQANAANIFEAGNVFYYKDANHPKGTGVKKVADGVTPLSSLPIIVDDYNIRGVFKTSRFDNFYYENNNDVFINPNSTFTNTSATNQTLVTNFAVKKPIKITRFILFVNSFTPTPNIELKLFRLNAAGNQYDQFYSQSFNVSTTGFNYFNLTTPQDLDINAYLLGVYTPNGNVITYRLFSDVYLGVSQLTGFSGPAGNQTVILSSSIASSASLLCGYTYQNII